MTVPLYKLVEARDLRAIGRAISEGEDVNKYEGEALKTAAALGYMEIVQLLIDSGADIYAADEEPDCGPPPLIHSASGINYCPEIVRTLIEKNGVNPRYDNDFLLKTAIDKKDLNMAQYLLNLGADINVSDNNIAILAVNTRSIDVIKFVIQRGVDIHVDNDYVLTIALFNKDIQTIKFLINEVGLDKTTVPNFDKLIIEMI